MRSTEAFTEKNYNSQKELIVYGANVYGEIAYYALEYLGIKPDYFVDKGIAGQDKFEIPVLPPQELSNHTDAQVIIASYNFFYEMKEECIKQGIETYYDMEYLLQVPFSMDKLRGIAKGRKTDIAGYRNMLSHEQTKDKVSINHIDFVVCESCTLKCKDCSNLMPYYSKPQMINLDDTWKSFDRFLETVDYIGVLYVLGGEPFLNKEVYKVIERYANCNKIGGITIFTNGTIIPDETNTKALKNDKVLVQISDYGVKHQKSAEVGEYLEKNGIKCVVKKYDEWVDLGDVTKKTDDKKVADEIIDTCFWKKNYTFLKGKVYHCPRSAHGHNLNIIPVLEEEYVDYTDETNTIAQLQTKLAAIVNRKEAFIACQYCKGGDWHSPRIQAAIQK